MKIQKIESYSKDSSYYRIWDNETERLGERLKGEVYNKEGKIHVLLWNTSKVEPYRKTFQNETIDEVLAIKLYHETIKEMQSKTNLQSW